MEKTSPTLVLLPGLGADGRLFEPQRGDFPNLMSPAWLEPTRRESLASYADRMAECIQKALPSDPRPFVLGGVSFGGMLAAQMAPLLQPDAIVLIGSALRAKEISFSLRAMAMAGRWMPAPMGQSAKFMGRGFIRRLGPMKREHRVFLESMIDAVPFSFLQWAGQAIFGWDGVTKIESKLIRLHGELDRIIPFPKTGLVHMIPGAGHVPNVSHADEVNRHLRAIVRNL
ncbi:MAG: alpha/beta fold hydrolase [Phycisphaerales bacterium]